MRKLSVLLCILGLFLYPIQQSLAQISMNGDLMNHTDSILDNMPGQSGSEYTDPDLAQFVQWKKLIDTLYDKNYSAAATLANCLNYNLIEFTDNGDQYYILQKQDTLSNHWGTYVYNPNACRDVVIQSPHPKFEYNTGKQGAFVMKNTNSRFFAMAGTHRCNDTLFSNCSGTTTVCDSTGGSYRLSDVAHNDSCIFQATTQALRKSDSELVFTQFHGFAKKATDPYVIMSNGTRTTPVPDYTDTLKNALAAVDTGLSFKVAHQDLNWYRLIGFTNVQGRYINESSNPCLNDADTTFSNFIHIEQEYDRLRKNESKWNKMVTAINNTFPCSTTVTEITKNNTSWNLYPNPSRDKATLEFENDRSQKHILKIYNLHGQLIKTNVSETNSDKFQINTHAMQSGIYFFRLHSYDQILARGKFIVK